MALGALLLKHEQKAREALKPTAKTTLPTSPPAIKTPVLDPQSELAETHKKIQAMLVMAALADYPLALENLRHWAGGSGTAKTMAAEPFKSAAFLQSHLQTVHRNKFVEGVLKRLSAREATVPSTVEMKWTDSVSAPYGTDLYFAVGGFTVESDVRVSVVPSAGHSESLQMAFVSWTVRCSEKYNWDPGKRTVIPFLGVINDAEMDRYERAGFAKGYSINVQPFDALSIAGSAAVIPAPQH